MSTPFTDIANAGGTGQYDYFNIDFLNEINLGVQERYPLYTTDLTTGTDFQNKRIYYDLGGANPTGWQYFLNLAYLNYIRLPNDYPTNDIYSDGDILQEYTWDTLMVDAGICPSDSSSSSSSDTTKGFRRATAYDPTISDWTDISDPMYEHGFLQPGDIIGPWIFVDLQNCLKKLLVKKTGTSGTILSKYGLGVDFTNNCGPARDMATTAYNDDWHTVVGPAGQYYIQCARSRLSYTMYQWILARGYSTYTRPSDATFDALYSDYTIDHIDLYGVCSASTVSPDYPTVGVNEAILIAYDMSAGQTAEFGKITTNPIDMYSASCDELTGQVPPYTINSICVYQPAQYVVWLDFTNA